jgi:hypothetical protein
MALRVNPRVAWQMVAGETVLVDLDRGHVLGLNDTGSFLWKRLTECSESQLASDLAATFDVDATRAQADVQAFLADLRARGYILD